MSTTVTGATTAQGTTANSNLGSTKLGKDAFLKLLTAQLANQDPMQPMDDKEFITQLAQFSSLEQMQSMNTNIETMTKNQTLGQAVNLIGKTITWNDPDAGTKLTGKVNGVGFDEDNSPTLKVGDKDIPMDYVYTIS